MEAATSKVQLGHLFIFVYARLQRFCFGSYFFYARLQPRIIIVKFALSIFGRDYKYIQVYLSIFRYIYTHFNVFKYI